MRPFRPADYEFLAELEDGPGALEFYRHRGATPPPEIRYQSLWASVLTQFIVEDITGARRAGIVSCYAADMRNRTAKLAAITSENLAARALAAEGTVLFVDYLFDVFGFRKLYADVLDFNLRPFARYLGDVFRQEGRLVAHEMYRGRPVDLHILAITAEDWYARRPAVDAMNGSLGPDELR